MPVPAERWPGRQHTSAACRVLLASPIETAVKKKKKRKKFEKKKKKTRSKSQLQLFLVTGAISKAAEISACFR